MSVLKIATKHKIHGYSGEVEDFSAELQKDNLAKIAEQAKIIEELSVAKDGYQLIRTEDLALIHHKIAMLHDALNSRRLIGWIHGYERTLYNDPTSGTDMAAVTLDFDIVKSALSATKETREKFIREIEAKALDEVAHKIAKSTFKGAAFVANYIERLAVEKRAK